MGKASAVVAFFAGMIAAWYWFRSTRISIHPSKGKTESGQTTFVMMKWIDSVMETSSSVSELNARAAGWTAISVFASGLSTLLNSY